MKVVSIVIGYLIGIGTLLTALAIAGWAWRLL